jgi:hypothetical protein
VVWSDAWDVAYALPTDGDNGNANARLIAAAPDLLAVLKELEESVDYLDVPVGIVERIRTVIRKAEGAK